MQLMQTAIPTAHFGSFFALLCNHAPFPGEALLSLLTPVLRSPDIICVRFGLWGVHNCAVVNPARPPDFERVFLGLAPELFVLNDTAICKHLFRALSDIAELPLHFVPLVFHKMASVECSTVLGLGCKLFCRQWARWKTVRPDPLPDLLFARIGDQGYRCQKRCMALLFLCYDLRAEHREHFCSLVIRFLEEPELALQCLRSLGEIALRYPADLRFLAPSYAVVCALVGSEDADVSEVAALVLDSLWSEDGKRFLPAQ
jgi:hypothetical protein